MAPLKRPAAASSGSAAKKSKGVSDQLKKVASALKGAESYPAPIISMLTESLHLSLGSTKEERHDFQEKVNSMTAEVLGSIQAAAEKKVADAETKVAEAGSVKASHEAEETAAKTAAEGAKQATEAAEKDLDASAADLKVKTDELKLAKKEQKAGTAELQAAEIKKTRVEQVFSTQFTACKEGTLEAGALKSAIAEVCKLGKELELDNAMIHSLPSALGKAPSARGSFDELVVQQMETQLSEHKAKLTAQLEAGAATRQGFDDKVAAAQAAMDAATATQTSMEEALKTAQGAEKEAGKAAQTATKAVKKFLLEMKSMDTDLAEAKKALEDYASGPMAAFKELLERSSVVPEEPVAEETAHAAEETTAAVAEIPQA